MTIAATLRHNAIQSQHRLGDDRRAVTFTGGPLDGLALAVRSDEARAAMLAWATVTATGCVQAIYRRGNGGFTFDGLEWNVC